MTAPKLTVELVPQTCWYTNVRSNITPADWQRCKAFVRRRSADRCETCGGRGPKWPVECHETWQYDDAKLIQRLDGLTALCPACHEVKHIGRAEAVGRLDPALDHLATVNGWTRAHAREYVAAAADLWDLRSGYAWALDVTWLATIGVTVPDASDRR